MYIWKLWRDTRARFLGCLALGMVWAGSEAYFTAIFLLRSPTHIRPLVDATGLATLRHSHEIQQTLWSGLAPHLLGPVLLVGLLAAIAFCGPGLGSDLARGTVEVLFSRPRRRRYFSWAGWAFNACQLMLLMYLIVFCGAGIMFYLTGTVLSWRPFLVPLLVLPSVLLLFGVAYLAVVLTDGHNGGSIAVGLLLVYAGSIAVLYFYWRVQPPAWWFDSLSNWIRRGQAPFPVLPVLGWSLAALVFPLLTQWSLQRKQV